MYVFLIFFFNDTATTEIYTLSLHDALPICLGGLCLGRFLFGGHNHDHVASVEVGLALYAPEFIEVTRRSEEHTSELQSRQYLVCRLLLEKKNNIYRQCQTPLSVQCH